MATSVHVDAVRSAVAALNAGEADAYLDAFNPECLRWVAGVAEPVPLGDIAANIEQLYGAFHGFHLHEDALFGGDRLVCARWRMTGTHTGDYLGIGPTRREVVVANCEVYEFEADGGGLVRASWSYGDPLELFRQLGAIPGAETGA